MQPDWDELARMLLRRARALGASAEEAEDLAQATLLRYVRQPSSHDPSKGALPAWLCTVLKRSFLDRRRRGVTRVKAVPVLRLVQPALATPAEELERRRAAERRQRFLDALTREERRVFEAWVAQRRGDFDAHSASASVDELR